MGDRQPPVPVVLRSWAEGDLWLLRRLLGEPEMTRYLGGPEPPEAIEARHRRYVAADPATNGLYAVVLPGAGGEAVAVPTSPDGAAAGAHAVGWVGFWESQWQGEAVWECGWSVLPEAQGRGVATAAATLMIAEARRRHRHRRLQAFPSVDNTPSNALCRTLGFTSFGTVEVEYPKGHLMRSVDWRYDLWPSGGAGGGSARDRVAGRPGQARPHLGTQGAREEAPWRDRTATHLSPCPWR